MKLRVKSKRPLVKSNVVLLRISEPNPLLVKMLKGVLARAETGEIQGYIGCFIFDNSRVDETWVEAPGPYMTSISSDRIVGCLQRLGHKILAIRTRKEIDRFIYFEDD